MMMALIIAPWPVIGVRLGMVVAGIVVWYWTQAVLGKRVPKVDHEVPLTDGIHLLTARFHHRYATNVAAGNRLLIASSLVIDLLGGYLLCTAIFGASIRPYLGLVIVFALRQICQTLCPLPAPAGMVWRYPGVPAVLVTYGTANDLFSPATPRSPSTAPPPSPAVGAYGAWRSAWRLRCSKRSRSSSYAPITQWMCSRESCAPCGPIPWAAQSRRGWTV